MQLMRRRIRHPAPPPSKTEVPFRRNKIHPNKSAVIPTKVSLTPICMIKDVSGGVFFRKRRRWGERSVCQLFSVAGIKVRRVYSGINIFIYRKGIGVTEEKHGKGRYAAEYKEKLVKAPVWVASRILLFANAAGAYSASCANWLHHLPLIKKNLLQRTRNSYPLNPTLQFACDGLRIFTPF